METVLRQWQGSEAADGKGRRWQTAEAESTAEAAARSGGDGDATVEAALR